MFNVYDLWKSIGLNTLMKEFMLKINIFVLNTKWLGYWYSSN